MSSPLNAKAGTFSHARYLYSVCRHLHSQGVVGRCYSQSGPRAKCLTGVPERWIASTFSSAQCSATWQPFGVASCSPPFPCPFLGPLLTNQSSWPVLVSPSQRSWLDSVALPVLLTWQICNSPLSPQVLLLTHSIFQFSDLSLFYDFLFLPCLHATAVSYILCFSYIVVAFLGLLLHSWSFLVPRPFLPDFLSQFLCLNRLQLFRHDSSHGVSSS